MALESFLVPGSVCFSKRVTRHLEMEQAKRGFISLSVTDVGCLIDLTSHKPAHLPRFWELKKHPRTRRGGVKTLLGETIWQDIQICHRKTTQNSFATLLVHL